MSAAKKFDLVFFKRNIALILFLALLIFNLIVTPNFISWVTFTNLITQVSRVSLVSLGMTLVIATGGIDISVGSTMALGSILCAMGILNHSPGLIILSIVVCIAFGCFSGIAVSKFLILPMVATLAMRYVMRGMAKGITGSANITYEAPKLTKLFTEPIVGHIPFHLVILVIAVLVMYILVNKTKFGVRVEAYGNNPVAARNSGINTFRIVVVCYAIIAFFSWIAGMLEAVVVSSAHPSTIGVDMEIDAIAATLIGGTPIEGGYPNVMGTVWGSLLMQLVSMMCNMHNISYSVTLMLKAVIILAALWFHGFGKRSR